MNYWTERDRREKAEARVKELEQQLSDQFANQLGMADWVEQSRGYLARAERAEARVKELAAVLTVAWKHLRGKADRFSERDPGAVASQIEDVIRVPEPEA